MLKFNNFRNLAFAFLVSASLSGCDLINQIGIGSVESDQAAVIFEQLPPFLGGGLSSDIIRPGEKRILWPFERVYKISTGIREINWGSEDNLHTRTRDGSTITLAITVRYQVNLNPATLVTLVQKVAYQDQAISELVGTVVRSDVRLFMNKLTTEEFLKRAKIEEIQRELEDSVNNRLQPYGIEIRLFKLRDFNFNPEYQNLLDKIQETQEKREEAEQRKDTVTALKDKETRQAEGRISRLITQAKGELEMSTIRGKQYLIQKQNEAKKIEVEGSAQVAAIKAKLDAFSGPGGSNMLKLEIVKGLLASQSKFVVINQGDDKNSNQGINVQKVDTNQLLGQLGLLEGYQTEKPKAEVKN